MNKTGLEQEAWLTSGRTRLRAPCPQEERALVMCIEDSDRVTYPPNVLMVVCVVVKRYKTELSVEVKGV